MNINELLQQAVHHHQAGRLEEAERLYREILGMQPNHPDANHNLGVLAIQVDQAALGLPYLTRAWQIASPREQFCLTLTNCLLSLNRPHDALSIIKDATQKKGFNSAQVIQLLQLVTSIAEGERPTLAVEKELSTLFGAGQYAALEERLTPLLTQYPNWGAGWHLLCTALQLQGKDSEHALQRAVQVMQRDGNARENQRKVFCIGANKTGTTSLEHVLRDLGIKVGNQGQAEMLIHDWAKGDYRRIIAYCRSAEAFQDVPFSLPGTFQAMDEAFPGSKFILTVRNDADEWFGSLVRFHTKIVGKGRIPTADDLRQFDYRYPGFVLDVLRLSYGAGDSTLYNRDLYIQYYERHNDTVTEYFNGRSEDLLVLNVGESDAMERVFRFLGYPYSGQQMPHLNASQD